MECCHLALSSAQLCVKNSRGAKILQKQVNVRIQTGVVFPKAIFSYLFEIEILCKEDCVD